MNFMDILRSLTGADNYFDRVPVNQLAAAGQPAHPSTPTPQKAYGNGYGDSVPSPGFGASMHTLGQALSPVQPAQAATLPAGTASGPQPATPNANDLTAALVRSTGAPAASRTPDPWEGLRTAVPNSGVTGGPGSVTLIPNGQNPFGSLAPQGISAQATSPMTTGSTTPAKAPSLFDRFENFTASPRGRALADMFAGWAMGKTPQQSLGYGARLMVTNKKDRRAVNDTVEWLTSKGIDKGEAEALARNPTALSAVLKQMLTPQKPTADIQNYQYAVQNGYKGNFAQWQKDKGSGVTVNLPGAPTIGTIPQGYAAQQDPQTGKWTMQPIAGGPADPTKIEKQQADAKETTTDVVSNAYEAAKKLMGPSTTGIAGSLISHLPPSNAAELRRQVKVLTSNASIEALNAMRRQSKTGGALGNVTEKEEQLLAATAGAINPDSSPEQFKTQLDNYYHTLLRIVNGPEAGDAMFAQMQRQGSGGARSGWTDLGNGVKIRKIP